MNVSAVSPLELRAFRLRLVLSWGILVVGIALASVHLTGWSLLLLFPVSHVIRSRAGIYSKPISTRNGVLLLAGVLLVGACLFGMSGWEGWQWLDRGIELLLTVGSAVLVVFGIRHEVRLFRFGPPRTE